MIITDRYDQIVCGMGNITVEVADSFSRASSFESYIPDRTGHDLNTHYSAPETIGATHAWLTKVGF